MTFTIDNENNITAHGTLEEAAAATATPFDSFGSQRELAELAKSWPAERLVAIWNSLTGVTPVETFHSHQTAARRIWKRIQGLGLPERPRSERPPQAKVERKAKRGAGAAKGAPGKGKATRRAAAHKNAPKGKKASHSPRAATPREGTKTAQVVAMLRRKGGATISEIMKTMGWQRHTVRGFMAGAMKKAGHTVESFKPDGGDRNYRLCGAPHKR